MRHKIKRLPWAGNSTDLNMIEPTWPHLKRRTTSRGAPSHRKTAASLWIKMWADLEQEAIQKWIERIPYHIKNVIKLRGGNEYPEGKHTI
jgi:transposase